MIINYYPLSDETIHHIIATTIIAIKKLRASKDIEFIEPSLFVMYLGPNEHKQSIKNMVIITNHKI